MHIGHRAVVDMVKLMTEHRRFQAMLKEIANEEQATAEQAGVERQEIDTMMARRAALPPLSDKAGLLTKQIILREAKLKRESASAAEESRRKRENIKRSLNNELSTEIEYFARRHGISVVLNHDSAEIGEDLSLEDAKALFQRNVAFQDNIDITFDTLDRL